MLGPKVLNNPLGSFYRNYFGQDVTDNKTSDIFSNCKQVFFMMNDNFHREDERLKTFEKWPLEWLDKKQLAQTGMFYTGDEDKVKCYFCEVEIGRWEREDQPVPEHLHWSPHCPLLRGRTTNNVPINAEELNHILPPISYDVCGTHDSFESSRPNVYAEYPEYAIEASRERSFTDWPRHMKQTPAQMAEAGFFHSGNGDRVKCFSCGGGLKDWDDSDEPWEQHALWLPKCRFLKLMKGQNFIDAVLAKQQKANENNENGSGEKPNCSTTTTATQMPPNVVTVATAIETTTSVSNSTANTPNTRCEAISSVKSNQGEGEAQALSPLFKSQEQGSISNSASPATSLISDAITSTSTSKSTSTCSIAEKCASASPSQITNNNNNIPEEKLCKICYSNEYNTAFLPCGHVVACAKCASSVTKCPMCRKHFTDIMRVYFS